MSESGAAIAGLLLFRWPQFLSPDEVAGALDLVADDERLSALGVSTLRDSTGSHCDLRSDSDPRLLQLRDRILDRLGITDARLDGLRFRRYYPGQAHPAHFDDYELDGRRLCVTVLLGLEAPTSGGTTRFPTLGHEEALAVGDAFGWVNLSPGGAVYPDALHAGAEVLSGRKATLGCFVYADPAQLPASRFLSGVALPEPPLAPGLYCIDAGVPRETKVALRNACDARGVQYVSVSPAGFDFLSGQTLPRGSMLFAPSTSAAALRLEQFLCAPGVATLYADGHGPDRYVDNQLLTLERAGVPVPRTVYGLDDDPALLASYVERLGGFPLVLKVQGYSLGVGIMQVDTLPGLLSAVEFLRQTGRTTLLQARVMPSTHWRLVVVGTEVVASYRNPVRSGDFRSEASEDPADYAASPPEAAARAARKACAVLGLEHGGVDVLEHDSGRIYVLEVNFPCYFGHAQIEGGVDVAGAIVDHLLVKAGGGPA